MANNALQGLTVLVTRPKHQAHELVRAIQAEGGVALEFPVLDIIPYSDEERVDSHIAKITAYDFVIFVSQYAVMYSAKVIQELLQTNRGPLLATVGNATAMQLEQYGLKADVIAPKPYNSESLLSIPEFEDCQDARILLVKGYGGREFLKDTLLKRGALVDELLVYHRQNVKYDVLPKKISEVNIILVTSNDILQNIWNILVKNHKQDWILNIPLVVFSERQSDLAQELGFTKTPLIAQSAENKAILVELENWSKRGDGTKR